MGKFVLLMISIIFMLLLNLRADIEAAMADGTYSVEFVFDASDLSQVIPQQQATPQAASPSNTIETKPVPSSSSGSNTSSNKQPASKKGETNTASAIEQSVSTEKKAVTSRETIENTKQEAVENEEVEIQRRAMHCH